MTTGLAVLLLGVTLSACRTQEPAPGNRLLLVGDSIVAGSKATTNPILTYAGWDPVVQAQAGTGIEDWANFIEQPVGKFLPDAVVVELGTNDCGTLPCRDLQPYIDRLMGHLSSIKVVVWLTVQTDAIIPYEPEYVNFQIESAAARWPNLTTADMGALFEGHNDWRTDGTHPNEFGQRQMAKLIVQALEPYKPR